MASVGPGHDGEGALERGLGETMDELLEPRIRDGCPGPVIRASSCAAGRPGPELPLLGCHVALDDSEETPPFGDSAIVVGVCLETKRVFAGPAFAPSDPAGIADEEPETEAVGDDAEVSGQCTVGLTFQIDLLDRLPLPPGPGEYLVTLIVRDQPSNPVRVMTLGLAGERVESDGPRPDDPAAHTPAPLSVSPSPGEPLPSYDRLPASPPIPEEPGIAMAADAAPGSGGQSVVLGSYRLPLLPVDVVSADERAEWSDEAVDPPFAVIPITLVITASDIAGPILIPLFVPTHEPDSAAPLPMVTGHFALDLATLDNMWSEPHTCYVYAFADEIMAGPTTIEYPGSSLHALEDEPAE